MHLKKSLLAISLLASAAAFAEAPTIPEPTCVKPLLPPGITPLSKAQADKLNADNKTYERCVTDYHNTRKALVDEHNAIAVANATAAKKLDEEFNSYVESLNASLAAREKASKAAE